MSEEKKPLAYSFIQALSVRVSEVERRSDFCVGRMRVIYHQQKGLFKCLSCYYEA